MRYLILLLLLSSLLLFAGQISRIDLNIPEAKVDIYRSHGGFYELRIDGFDNYGHCGEPKLPYIHRRISIAGRWKIDDVEVLYQRWSNEKKLPDGVVLVPVGTPHPISSGIPDDYIPNEQIYSADEYFPKNFFCRWHCGSSNDSTYVFLNIPLVRYNAIRGEYRILIGAKISINGRKINYRIHSDKSIAFDDENIILTVQSLHSAAESLAALHDEWGISSAIITAEEIDTTYSAAEYPPYWGFPDAIPIGFYITADTELAMKIVSFLRDYTAHPSLQSITILGDATQIPPSYYFRDSTDLAWGGDEFDAFVPTDFFYSSPDYDWVANYDIGRIPVSEEYTAIFVVDRLRRWVDAATPELFNNILFAAGMPFSDVFDGEHTTMLACRDGYIANADLTKLYASRGEYSKSNFDEAFREDYGIVYIFAHGSGYSAYFDDGTNWSTEDADALPYRDFAPIMMMGSCLNGIYDGALVGWDNAQFPKVLIPAPGGPIAFWGCSRTAYSAPDYYFNGPEIIITEPYHMSRYNFDFIEALGTNRPDNPGEWENATKFWYADAVDMTYWAEQRSFLEYNLFGDPVLPLPDYDGFDFPDIPGLSFDPPAFFNNGDFDSMAVFLIDDDTLRPTADGDETAYSIPMINDKPQAAHLQTMTLSYRDEFPIYLPGGGRKYCLTTDSPKNVEKRYYFYAAPGDICIDGYDDDWNYQDISYSALDPPDFEQDWLDLKQLYLTDDDNYLYIGFTTGNAWDYDYLWNQRIFAVAIDYTSGGYSGELSVDQDPFDTYVCFRSDVSPDLIAGVNWSYGYFDFKVCRWESDEWAEISSEWENGFAGAYGTPWYANAFGEIAIPKTYLTDADSVNLVVYSAYGSDVSPAQDCVPSDTATYSALTLGASNANRLSAYYPYHFTAEVSDKFRNTPQKLSSISISPNPFNSVCRIAVAGDDNFSPIGLKIFDISGNLITEGQILPHQKQFLWNAKNLPSGIYFVKFSGENFNHTRRAILVR
ncbi:T9SS type A sorting domain-containing protein [bacterium]|nr:T9SS type A sorting domain-containing protein [bacterium]